MKCAVQNISRHQYVLCVWITEQTALDVVSGLLNWEMTWWSQHVGGERCVTHSGWWVMAVVHEDSMDSQKWQSQRGITLKSAADISWVLFYCAGLTAQGLPLSVRFLFKCIFSHILLSSRSSRPSLPLLHPPLTACWLNKWPSFILHEQLTLMRILAADRALGTVQASD